MAEIYTQHTGLTEALTYHPVSPRWENGMEHKEHLSIYVASKRKLLTAPQLNFEITRLVKVNQQGLVDPHKYGARVFGAFPMGWLDILLDRVPNLTPELLSKKLTELENFNLVEAEGPNSSTDIYSDVDHNIKVDWFFRPRLRWWVPPQVEVQVASLNSLANFELVVQQMVPRVVKIFNYLSPTWQIDEDVVKQSEALARQSQRFTPKLA